MTEKLELMEMRQAWAGGITAKVWRSSFRSERFEVPIWFTRNGELQIALPVEKPQHSSDCLYVRFQPVDALEAVAFAAKNRPSP